MLRSAWTEDRLTGRLLIPVIRYLRNRISKRKTPKRLAPRLSIVAGSEMKADAAVAVECVGPKIGMAIALIAADLTVCIVLIVEPALYVGINIRKLRLPAHARRVPKKSGPSTLASAIQKRRLIMMSYTEY